MWPRSISSELPEFIGFFSYSRRDDQHSTGSLSRLRACIQSELRLQMGRDFRLWQDTAAIPDGALWEDEIRKAIAESVFFIPIVTPSAVSSKQCAFEFESFRKREAALGRNDLIFPILYITVEALEHEQQWRENEVLKIIGSRQYLDWRKYRHHDPSSTEAALQIEQFCRNIYKSLHRPFVPPGDRKREEEAEARSKAQGQQRRNEELAEAQKKAREEEAQRKAEAETRALAEEQHRRLEAEAKQRAEQEKVFAAAKRADTVSAIDSFLDDHPESHLAEEARTLRETLMTREHVFAHATGGDDTAAAMLSRATHPVGSAGERPGRFKRSQPASVWRLLPVVLIGGALVSVSVGGGIWFAMTRLSVQPSATDVLPLSLEREQALKPRDSFKECTTCPQMMVVPAGNFTMGSPEDEPGRNNNETRMRFTIALPFAVGKYAVTFDEWEACAANGGCNGYAPPDAGWGRGRRPVINVSWQDAKAYVAWLSSKTGKPYRLLSEAEREYVTRAGTTTPFWWGSSITPAQANYNGSYVYQSGGSKGTYLAQTVPVDSFAPNPWGLYQVHGNVWEWTDDCWNNSNTENPGDGTARESEDCGRRVVRGGSWYNSPVILRSASRGNYPSNNRNAGFGFRIARTLNP
jgi:formylglycine-generating enzyme required for sulfatase activity